MDTQTLELVYALQHSLCELLIYSNRTSDYAQRAQTVAQEAAIVLRQQGQVPGEVPGLVGAGKEVSRETDAHSATR